MSARINPYLGEMPPVVSAYGVAGVYESDREQAPIYPAPEYWPVPSPELAPVPARPWRLDIDARVMRPKFRSEFRTRGR